MSVFFRFLIIAAMGYLLGNFNTGLIVSKSSSNIDIRKHGSGNAGTTNMLRVLGRQSALITLIGDMLKGIIAMIIGGLIAGFDGSVVAGTCSIIGHCWPVFFGFKGGKGVATSFAVVTYLFPMAGLLCLVVFLAVFLTTRLVSLGSIAAGLFGSVYVIAGNWGNVLVCCAAALWAIIILGRHHTNLKRIWEGTEGKLDFAAFKSRKNRAA